MTDDFTIGGMTLNALTMAVATQAAYVPTGIMGIGFDTDESIAASSGESTIYNNLIDELVIQGLIDSKSYSLWLNDLCMSLLPSLSDVTQLHQLFELISGYRFGKRNCALRWVRY